MERHGFEVRLDHRGGYEFTVEFPDTELPALRVDEAPPIGDGLGPNPARCLAVAVGHCLSASLLFCLRRAHLAPRGLRTTVRGTLVRNEEGRLRVGGLDVTLEPDLDPKDRRRLAACLDVFEQYCVVTQSVRGGIPVSVQVPSVAEGAEG